MKERATMVVTRLGAGAGVGLSLDSHWRKDAPAQQCLERADRGIGTARVIQGRLASLRLGIREWRDHYLPVLERLRQLLDRGGQLVRAPRRSVEHPAPVREINLTVVPEVLRT